jgi:flagellin-like protein
MMKGISPLVASVLLIAITMSVAGILAYWVSSFTGQTLPKMDRTEECRFSNFEIWSCSLNPSTRTISFTLHNIGRYEITDLAAFIETDGVVGDRISLNSSLSIGDFKTFTLTNIPVENFSRLIITTSCPDLTKESFCTGR